MANVKSKITVGQLYFMFIKYADKMYVLIDSLDSEDKKIVQHEYEQMSKRKMVLIDMLQSHEQGMKIDNAFYVDALQRFISDADKLESSMLSIDKQSARDVNKSWESLKFGLQVFGFSEDNSQDELSKKIQKSYEAGYEDGIKARFARRTRWNNDGR
jgi:hypothetical protein